MERGNEKKLKELILYIARRSEDDPNYGAVKLNKILYRADFRAYLELGRPITGAPYVALEMGPGPYRLPVVRDALIDAGDATLDRELLGKYYIHRLVALRDADVSLFREGELELVDRVIEELRPLGWKALSDATHAEPGWAAAKPSAIIPYESAFVSSKITKADRDRATTAIAQLNG